MRLPEYYERKKDKRQSEDDSE
jgi:hypothetical protein